MIYLDASALVKLVVREAESEALFRYLGSRPARISSALSQVEVVRALRRSDRQQSDLERAARALDRVALVPIDDTVLRSAARIEPTALRSLDSIHLATALTLPPLDAFVAYDDRLIEGARQLGCEVVSPD